jgi:hypothetical protein
MILNFTEAAFIPTIIHGAKLHTIRKDAGERWQVGARIDFWFGFPRVQGSGAWKFGTGTVAKIMPVMVGNGCAMFGAGVGNSDFVTDAATLDAFARNDGFSDYAEMRAWFVAHYGKGAFHGRLIIWAQPIVPARFKPLVLAA